MSLERWKVIQSWAGVAADGIPGGLTAKAIIDKAGIELDEAETLVLGTGKNIKRIFVHSTATREGQDIDAATIKKWHLRQGWSDIGYHFVIKLDGEIERGRSESKVGSHVKGYNTGSIALVYVGGLDSQGKAKDTRTPMQTQAMAALIDRLVEAYPNAEVLGHRDIWPEGQQLKECPCFDVKEWWYGEEGGQ